MNKKIFTIADIHGHYQEMIDALSDKGYDSDNDNHLLIVLGDMFDRGRESMSVYTYLKQLAEQGKAIILKGNHEPMFTKWLNGDDSTFNYQNNGVNETIDDFLHSTSDFQMFVCMHQDKSASNGLQEGCTIGGLWHHWCAKSRKQILDEYDGILEWLNNLPDYYETKNYIFAHGAIDGQCPDWHYPHKDMYGRFMDWEACAWDDGSFFNSAIVNTDKTVVIGHFHTGHLRKMYNIGDEDDNSILIRDDGKVIAIDGCTILSKQVNVLVIDEEELLDA